MSSFPMRVGMVAIAVTLLASACDRSGRQAAAPPADPAERAGGGATSVAVADLNAFARPAANLDFIGKSLFENGNHLFRTPRGAERGTGPISNAQTCQGCHVRDGRGQPPRDAARPLAPAGPMVSMLLRLARLEADGGFGPDPVYGGQLQTRGVDGDPRHDGALGDDGPALGEARVDIAYEPIVGRYPDGTPYELLRPVYRISEASYGPFAEGIRFSPRVAPAVFGAGLLEAIPEADLLTAADPDDADGNGISGRPNRVVDPVSGTVVLGRFGLKAGAASVLAQSAAAYRNDMGLTSALFPTEPCTGQQPACLRAAMRELAALREPDGVDLTDLELAQVELYTRTLAVPMRRGWDEATADWAAEIKAGRGHFERFGCAACHVPEQRTGTAAGSALGAITDLVRLERPAPPLAALSGQRIFPYTDLLLHDMGGRCEVSRETAAGEACTAGAGCHWVQRCSGLADRVPEGDAGPSEWRTPPLWGLGLVQTVNPQAGFLHDGRARTIEEAILWHAESGGEAAPAADAFRQADGTQRAELLHFLESL
ncbi:MAG: thiol oxidoreductase [Burkholderiaceae bacterium]|nr:thiol oxidoreductase [Burkholderiaceae bacterium]